MKNLLNIFKSKTKENKIQLRERGYIHFSELIALLLPVQNHEWIYDYFKVEKLEKKSHSLEEFIKVIHWSEYLVKIQGEDEYIDFRVNETCPEFSQYYLGLKMLRKNTLEANPKLEILILCHPEPIKYPGLEDSILLNLKGLYLASESPLCKLDPQTLFIKYEI